jgi:hypothetical protein
VQLGAIFPGWRKLYRLSDIAPPCERERTGRVLRLAHSTTIVPYSISQVDTTEKPLAVNVIIRLAFISGMPRRTKVQADVCNRQNVFPVPLWHRFGLCRSDSIMMVVIASPNRIHLPQLVTCPKRLAKGTQTQSIPPDAYWYAVLLFTSCDRQKTLLDPNQLERGPTRHIRESPRVIPFRKQ